MFSIPEVDDVDPGGLFQHELFPFTGLLSLGETLSRIPSREDMDFGKFESAVLPLASGFIAPGQRFMRHQFLQCRGVRCAQNHALVPHGRVSPQLINCWHR